MFLLPSLVFGLVFAVVLGGKPARALAVRFRLPWAVVLALGLQAFLFSRLAAGVDDPLRNILHVASYGLLIAFAAANLRIRAFVPVLLGICLNALVIAANGGRMPLSASAARAAGAPFDEHSNVSEAAHRLRFLGDVFALPRQLPFANVFSLGDVLISFGMIAFIVVVSTHGDRERVLNPFRLLEPFRAPTYRLLATGKLISHLGDWLTLAALIGWIYQATGSTGAAAGLLLSRLAPPIVGGGVAALVVDRLPKQRLLVWIELGRGIAVAGALGGVLADERAAVFAALACSGALAAISNAAVPALLPSLLPAAQLASANAGLGIARDGAMAIGAGGAGLALSWFGPAPALAADLGTFAVAIALFSALHVSGPVRRRREPASPSGLRYLVGHRALLLLVLSFAAATLATGLTNASLPRFFERQVGFGAGGYGFGIAALAAGLALGQGLIGLTRAGPTAGRWIGAGLLAMAGLFALLGLSEHAPTALLIIGAIGFVDGTTDTLFDTVIQRRADPRYYGAIFGFASALITTTMMAAVAAAPLANRIAAPRGVLLSAAVFLVAAGTIALVGMSRRYPAAAPRTALRPGT